MQKKPHYPKYLFLFQIRQNALCIRGAFSFTIRKEGHSRQRDNTIFLDVNSEKKKENNIMLTEIVFLIVVSKQMVRLYLTA